MKKNPLNTALCALLLAIFATLFIGLINEPPKIIVEIVNTSPENLPNAVFYAKVLSKEQMRRPVIYKITTTQKINVKEIKRKGIAIYQSRIEGGEYQTEIFTNFMPAEFAGTPPTH